MSAPIGKVSLIGVCPRRNSVIGGVSIHLLRLAQELEKRGMLSKLHNTVFVQKKVLKFRNNKFEVDKEYNPFGIKQMVIVHSAKLNSLTFLIWLFRYGIFDNADIFHVHNEENHPFVFWLLRKFFKKKLLISIHDQMRLSGIKGGARKMNYFLTRLFNDNNVKWIAVNKIVKEQLMEFGVAYGNVKIIPAYIKSNENAELPNNLDNFIKEHSPIISVYAVGTIIFKNQDLYGIDLSLSLISEILRFYPKVGLVICIPGEKDQKIIEGYNKIIEDNKITKNVFFQSSPLGTVVELWKRSDIHLRPTNTDGDALSIREALSSKTIVIASDVVDRPSGCTIFKNRDLNDLTEKILDCLQNKDYYIKNIPDNMDFFEDIVNYYKEIRTN